MTSGKPYCPAHEVYSVRTCGEECLRLRAEWARIRHGFDSYWRNRAHGVPPKRYEVYSRGDRFFRRLSVVQRLIQTNGLCPRCKQNLPERNKTICRQCRNARHWELYYQKAQNAA